MKKFDIEAYLDGNLSGDELEAFRQEMTENPAFARQVEQQRKISQHLRTQLLREHVASALSVKPRTGVFRWLGLAGGTLLILLVVYLFVFQKAPKDTPVPGETKQEIQPAAPTNPAPAKTPDNPTLEQAPKPRPSQPIAYNRPSGSFKPDYPAPNIRGQQDGNSAWQKTLDQLWFTQFPPQNTTFSAPFSEVTQLLTARDFPNAFVELETLEQQQTQNDTLRLLKAYCLLEMGEGAEALRYFDQLELNGRQSQWSTYLDWHRTLCHLAIGEKEQALPVLRKMSKSSGHPFHQQSLRALEVLK
jgi:hypothetical protein